MKPRGSIKWYDLDSPDRLKADAREIARGRWLCCTRLSDGAANLREIVNSEPEARAWLERNSE